MEEIRKVIGDLKLLEFKDARNTSFKCMDGRENNAIFATPGVLNNLKFYKIIFK